MTHEEFMHAEGRRILRENWEDAMGIKRGMNDTERRQVLEGARERQARVQELVVASRAGYAPDPNLLHGVPGEVKVIDMASLEAGNVIELPIGRQRETRLDLVLAK